MTSVEKRLRVMLFKQMIHNRTINVTVRRGSKWADLGRDQEIVLASQNGTTTQKAHVICAQIMPFSHIPDALIEHEHDPECRDRDGLLKTMQSVYPGFMETEAVTVVLYYVN